MDESNRGLIQALTFNTTADTETDLTFAFNEASDSFQLWICVHEQQ